MSNQKANASQKLSALEKSLASLTARLDQQFSIVAEEINRLNDISAALAKRLNAIVKAGDNGTINSTSIKDVITNDAAKELKSRVDGLVSQGILTLNNDLVISADTFVVGRETDFEGNEVNPRIQMLVSTLQPEIQEKLLGKKVGDEIKDDNIKQILIITEVYQVNRSSVKENQEDATYSNNDTFPASLVVMDSNEYSESSDVASKK